jgi:hypothetical protein
MRLPLATHFLRHLGEPPWNVIAGGKQRSFNGGSLPELAKWVGAVQGRQLGAYVSLPDTGGHVWHLAIRAPQASCAGDLSLPPSLIVSADELFMVWRLNDPIKPAEARRLSNELAKQIRGTAIVGEQVPLPGTLLFKSVGTRLVGRFPVQMLPPILTAYRVADGKLTVPCQQESDDASPFMAADGIKAEAMEWLWPDFIPLGPMTLLGGAPGMGKSQAAISIAATLSTGGMWPSGDQCARGSALVLEAEDDLARTVAPRLMAAGADMSRVSVGKVIDLSQGPAMLEAEWKRRKDLRLVVMSPIRKFVGKAEDHGNLGVRKVLQPILDWAEKRRVALVGIVHPLKGKEHKVDAFAGSPAFLEMARAALTLMPDPTSKEKIERRKPRILTHAKANIGRDDAVMKYLIEGVTIDGIETSRIVWRMEDEQAG